MPSSILERVPKDSVRYIESADKAILGDPVIKDVCGTCNGGVLSALDAYGCTLFDEQFCNAPTPATPVTFTYDFNQLARWLLKISFNSARSSKHADADVLANYVPDITQGTTPRVTICLELIEPAIGESQTDSGIVVVEKINPTTLRISRILLKDGFVPSLHIVRLVAIQAYWFALAIPTKLTHPETELSAERQEIISKWPGTSVLPDDCDKITLSTLGNDVVEMSRDNILAKKDVYQAGFDRLAAKRNDA